MSEIINSLDIPILSAKIKVEVTRNISWNSFPGSVIHGIIGFKLKDLTCVITHRNCKKCYLVHTCPYGIIYESPLPPETTRMRLYPQAPHPVRVTVYPWHKPELLNGEKFEISVTLFGKAITNFLLILIGIETALAEGVGRKHNGARGTAKILTVADKVSEKEKKWSILKNSYSNFISSFALRDLTNKRSKKNVIINIKSPLKIVTENKINYNPSVRDIMSNLLRRLGNICYFYYDRELDLDYKGILDRAVKLDYTSELKRVKAIRYSSSQSKTISMAGLTGEISIKECPQEIAAFLEIGSYIGIGKSTTMGLGDYSVRI